MMKIVVIFALFVVAALAQTCLPSEYATNVWGIPVVLDTPVTIQPGAYCNKNGDSAIQSCCDQATLQKFADFWAQYKKNVDASGSAFIQAAKGADAGKLVYGALPANIPISALPQAAKDALQNVIDAYQTFLNNGPKNFQSCLDGLGQYYQGILCGFCSTNWNKMVTVQSSNGGTQYTAAFDLSDSTCDKLGGACLPFIKSAYPVFQAIINLAKAFGLPNDLSGLLPCADDNCPQFACDSLVYGFSVPVGNINFTDIALGGVEARATQTAIAMTRSPREITKFFTAPRQSSAQVKQTNSYSANGYDAYGAGANAAFSGSSNSGSSSSAYTVIPSVIAGLVAVAFAL